MDFVHLHLHTEYSLLDGAIRIKDLPGALKAAGMTSCAITDHGSMYGIIEFYKTCKENGIKPIIGCEVYVAARLRTDKNQPIDRDPYHMILLARNDQGFKNLIKLVSIGYLEGHHYRPRIDRPLLENHSEGLIGLSACLKGEIPRRILDHQIDEALEVANYFDNLFGRDYFYLEMQQNEIPEQSIVNKTLVEISNRTGIPLVATNDCHYIKNTDAKAHEVLLCMQTGKKMSDPDRMKMMSDAFYLKSPAEMSAAFENNRSAIENTVKIAHMCNVEMQFGKTYLPEFNVPKDYSSHDEYLNELSLKGLKKRFTVSHHADFDHYEQRLTHELGVISQMGFTDYFLIVWDFIDFANRNQIMVGPGRGSGAGSLVAFCLGITNIDPIRYDLLFERFLNFERVSMPDFDIDFCYERRQEVIDYVTRKYGEDHVAQVITFGTLAAKACVKDVARALDMPYSESDRLSKMIPAELGVTLEKALKNSSELSHEYQNNPAAREVLDTAILFEGMPRHPSTHAAGVVISRLPITDIAPLARNDQSIVVQYTKSDIESVGLMKFDFLGLRTLTVMRYTADMIAKKHNVTVDYDALNMDDPKVYKMISEGNTDGIFQLESPGMTNFMKDLKPETMEDIIAGISLFRPGPMEQIPKYVASKNRKVHITYAHKLLEPILNVTYGCIVYQEQVMRVVRELAGFSMGQSDNVRRAMSKKQPAELAKYRTLFLYGGEDEKGNHVDGAIKRGVPVDVAASIFEEVMAFAGYAFNKSHAAAYAVIAYYTGWLKCYYPTEFMASMLNSFMGNLNQAARYINACRKMNIGILPPDINRSSDRFATDQGKIRFALSAIKNVGQSAIQNLLDEREKNGEFQSFYSFLERMSPYDLNKKMVESMIKASAFDCFQMKRSHLMLVYEPCLNRFNQMNRSIMEGQLSLFDMGTGSCDIQPEIITPPDIEEFTKEELLAMEREVLGLYVTGHPMNEYVDLLGSRVNCDSTSFVLASDEQEMASAGHQHICDGQRVVMAGVCNTRRDRITKKNEQMSILTMEDQIGSFECLVFPQTFKEYSPILKEGNILLIRGRINAREGENPKLNSESFALLDKDTKNIEQFPIIHENKKSYTEYFCDIPDQNILNDAEFENSLEESVDESFYQKHLTILLQNIPSSEEKERLLSMIEYFAGDFPVKIKILSTGETLDLDDRYKIRFDNQTISAIMNRVGISNVRLE
jgi:DNA polymerase III subunit alpha